MYERIKEENDFVVEYDKDTNQFRVSFFEDNHYKDEIVFNGILAVSLPDGGKLVASPSGDKDYPGIFIGYNNNEDTEDTLSVPGVLMEHDPDKGLRVMAWADRSQEDYSHEIIFE